MTKLLPCPFCGEVPHEYNRDNKSDGLGASAFVHENENCMIGKRTIFDDQYAAWNTRTPPKDETRQRLIEEGEGRN